MDLILVAVISLGAIGLIAAVILYACFHVLKPLFHHYSWFTAVKYLSIVVAFFIAFFIFRSASGSRYSQ